MNHLIALAIVGLAVAANVAGQTTHFQSGEPQTALLELYTSEGCSSCPPAEAWLNKLKSSPALWKDFVPVAFHVDYWNDLGWRDRWSSTEFADRQRAYAAQWQSSEIYTPEFVLNGAEWRNWFGLRGAPGGSGTKAGVLEISSTNNVLWDVSFTPATSVRGDYEIHAALLGGGLSSGVKAGENSGRTLVHEFTVLKLLQTGMSVNNGVARGKFVLEIPGYGDAPSLGIAAWITQRDSLRPEQATGGWIRPPASGAR